MSKKTVTLPTDGGPLNWAMADLGNAKLLLRENKIIDAYTQIDLVIQNLRKARDGEKA
jgi:hypothetical protein